MLTLDGIALEVPSPIGFSDERARERYPEDGDPSPDATWPEEARRHLSRVPAASRSDPTPDVRPAAPSLALRAAPPMLPVAPPGCSLSDLAIAAACRLRLHCGAAALQSVRCLALAHATLNENIAESAACRVQHALDLGHRLLPFSIGQCGTVGLYAALPVLDGLLADGERALLTAADKTLYPFFRVHGDLVRYGDAGGALIVRRHAPGDPGPDPLASGEAHARGRVEVLGHALAFGRARARARTASARAELVAELLDLVARAATAALARAGMAATAVDVLVPSGFQPAFRAAVAARLGFASERCMQLPGEAHLGSADIFSALAFALAGLAPGTGKTVLFCDAALCGTAGALLARLHRPRRDAASSPPAEVEAA